MLKQKKLFDLTKSSSIWVGIITVVVLVSNNIFSSTQNTNTTYLIIILVFVSLLFQGYLITTAVKKDFFDRIKDLETFIENNGLNQIISEKSLSFMESMADEIWVFTSDLKNDIGFNDKLRTQEIFQSVKKNIKQGKKYIYFLPNNADIRGHITEYKYIHQPKYENQIKFVLIKENHFHFVSEIAIYNPNNSSLSNAVQWFPDDEVNYYIGYDKEHKSKLIGIAKWLLNNNEISKIELFGNKN